MERRDSGYCAEMDQHDSPEDAGVKGILETLPEAGQGILVTLPISYGEKAKSVPNLTLDQQSNTHHTSDESASHFSFHNELEDGDGSDSQDDDDDAQTLSPNDFVFWEEPRSSPIPKKALLKATLSLPLSPSYYTNRPHSYHGNGSAFAFSIKEEEADSLSPNSEEGSLPPFRPRSGSVGKGKPVSSLQKLSTATVFYGELKDIIHEGILWQADISEGSKTEYWCVLQGGKFYIFESDHPECQMEKLWDLSDCKIGSVPRQVQVDLVKKLSLHYSFQIKQCEKSHSAIFGAKEEEICKTWIQKLSSVSSLGKKSKGHGLSFSQFSVKGRFIKSSNSFKHRNKDPVVKRPQMSKASFADLYGWSEQQSHRRVHRTAPIQAKAERYQKAKEGLQVPEQNRLYRASSDSKLAGKKPQDSLDRCHSAEPQVASWKTQRGKFGSLRKTLKALPQLGLTTQSTKKVQRPLTTSSSVPLEPAVKAGLLLVKRETSWKRCWLKIHGSTLHFYRDRNELLPFEVLSLNGYFVHRNPSGSSSGGQVRFRFSLQSEEKGSIHFLADTESEGKLWMKRFSEACASSNMDIPEKTNSSILRKGTSEYPEGYDHNFNDTSIHSDTSDSPTESPLLHQKRIMIQKKYQLANETEEMNSMKRSFILNQRRMSAQTKIDALDKQRLERKAKGKSKKGKNKEPSEEEYDASVRGLIEQLHQKVADIDRNLNENVLRTDQRRQALLRKQEMELEILHQEKELLKYRTQAQNALKTMMLKAVVQNLSSPLTEEKESDGDSPDSSSIVPVTPDGSFDDQNMQTKVMSNSISSSLSSLSSNGTNESMGSLQNHTKLNSRNYVEQTSLSSANSEPYHNNRYVSSPDLRATPQNREFSKRHSNVCSSDVDGSFQGIIGRLPDQDSLHTSDSDSPDIKVLSSEIKPKLRTEVPPDVLRDINEFEEMAKLALQKAGWLPPADLFLSH